MTIIFRGRTLSKCALIVLVGLLLLASCPNAFSQENVIPPTPVADELEARQLDFANGWLLRGNYTQAAREYEKFIQTYPNSQEIATAWWRLGETFYLLKDFPKAKESLDKALPLLTDYDRRRHTQLRLGEAAYHLGNHSGSVELLSTVLMSQPPPEVAEAALFYRGKSLLALGNREQALASFQEILDKHPSGKFIFLASLEAGHLHRSLGSLDRSLQAYQIIEKATPGDPRLPGTWALPEACYRKGSVLYEQKRFQDAVNTLRKGIADYPKSDLVLEMQHSLGWAYFGLKDYTQAIELADSLVKSSTAAKRLQGLHLLRANSQYELGNYAEASASYSEVARLVTDTAESRQQQAEALARLAWCHYLANRYDEALKAFEVAAAAAEIAPFLGDLKFLKGQILYLKDDPGKALLEFLDVLANHRESSFHTEVGYRLGWSYFKLERFQEAAEVWFTFALKYPDQDMGREAALMAGEATFKAGDFEQSLELFDHYITTYPQMPESETVLYRASVACYNIQKYDKMSEYLKQLIQRFPTTQYLAEAYYWLGFAASVREQTEEAEKHFSLLVQTQPQSQYASDALYRLGKIYYQKNKTDDSCQAFLRIVKEYPNHILPAEMLFWLGAQLSEAKRYDDAFLSYASLWDKHPSSELKGRAQFEAGNCLMQTGKLDEAEDLYRRMLQENQRGGYRGLAAYGLALVLMAKKDYAGALQQLQDSRDLLPDEWSADAGFRIGVCYRELNQTSEAFEAFMRVAILYDLETLSAQALWEAGQACDKLDEPVEAEKTYRELIKRYPETEWGNKARELLNARASQPVNSNGVVIEATSE